VQIGLTRYRNRASLDVNGCCVVTSCQTCSSFLSFCLPDPDDVSGDRTPCVQFNIENDVVDFAPGQVFGPDATNPISFDVSPVRTCKQITFPYTQTARLGDWQ
jgi:hypothetical protein